jgi:hypothetical protein
MNENLGGSTLNDASDVGCLVCLLIHFPFIFAQPDISKRVSGLSSNPQGWRSVSSSSSSSIVARRDRGESPLGT